MWRITTTAILALTMGSTACGDDSDAAIDARPGAVDARTIDASGIIDASCYENPQTHHELINGCTDPSVERIDKNPVLPLLEPDGSLPPLPE